MTIVSDILDEFNISLETLKLLETQLEYKFLNKNQSIPKNVEVELRNLLDKVKGALNDKKEKQDSLRNQNSDSRKSSRPHVKRKKIRTDLPSYKTKNNYKLIGRLKWFYNKQNNVEEGYIECSELSDTNIYFRSSDLKGVTGQDLVTNEVLVLNIPIQTLEYHQKVRASKVYRPKDENDLDFLLYECLYNNKQSLYSVVLHVLEAQKDNLNTKDFYDDISSVLANDFFNLKQAIFIYNFSDLCDFNNLDDIFLKVKQEYDVVGIFKFWQHTDTTIPLDQIKPLILEHISDTKSYEIFKKLSENENAIVLNDILNNCLENNASNAEVASVIKQFQAHQLDVDYSKFSNEQVFYFWKENMLDVTPFVQIKPLILEHISNTKSYEILQKLSEAEKEIVLNAILNNSLENNSSNAEVVQILKQFQAQDIDVDYSRFSNAQIIYFWKEDMFDVAPIDIIFGRIEELLYGDPEDQIRTAEIRDLFGRVTAQELTDLFSKIHFEKSEINANKDFDLSKFFIDHVPDASLKDSFFDTIYLKSSEYFKLKWFILDYTDKLEYHDVVIYTGLLNSKLQKLFFKKVLMLIATKQVDLGIEDLNKITTIDYQTSEYAREIDGVGLDFTLSIILKIASDLSNNRVTKRKEIFDIIAHQIKRPDDLLVISGFFDKCTGRTTIEEDSTEMKQKNGEEVPVVTYRQKKTDWKPRFSTFCDGRKAINRTTNEPSLCQKSGFEFWWCENSQCYSPCRRVHESSDWRDYTLEDVLSILNISYNQKQYEIVLNVINRVNRFLEHLTCKNCKSILKPNGKSNYAFYGVTRFSCVNNDCLYPDKDVYLSHCLNGKCEGIIDSRETVKCKPEEVDGDGNCGWYICQNCYGCCSTNKIDGRKYILERTGQEYTCHDQGHKDLGIICCPKCGTETAPVVINLDLYNRQLQWFIDNRNSSIILSSGQRQDGKWWFRWNKGNLSDERFLRSLRSLKRNGFNVPDIDSGNDVQFVSEPFGEFNEEPKHFKCPSCNFEIDLSDQDEYDYLRLNAIKSYHNKIFIPNPIKT